MLQKPSIKQFLLAFTSQWFIAMSGGLSVPLAGGGPVHQQ
jgi:hypothetical protein